jgi:hypothetical protein
VPADIRGEALLPQRIRGALPESREACPYHVLVRMRHPVLWWDFMSLM